MLAASLVSTSLHGLGGSTVRLLAELSFTSSPLGRQLYVNPWVSAAVEKAPVLPFPGLHVRLELDVRWDAYSDVYIRRCMMVKYVYVTPRPYA